MSNPETENQYHQPELPFPEDSMERNASVINESIPEDRFAVSSIRDVVGAWRNHFRERRSHSSSDHTLENSYYQPELPFPEAGQENQTEVIDANISEDQTALSGVSEVIRAWKAHLKNGQAKNEEFHSSLKATTQARLSGKSPEVERIAPRTRAERRSEVKAEKAIYKHARAKEDARWKDAVHGTRRGALSKSETRKARRDVIKTAKQLHKEGAIDGRELMKRVNESAGIVKYEESSVQKRARKNVDTAAEKVLKKSNPSRIRSFVGKRLGDVAETSDSPQQTVDSVPSPEVEPTERHDIDVVTPPSNPVEVTVHKRAELFPAMKAKSFKFDKQGKLASTHTGPIPTREKQERPKGDKRKSRETDIPKEVLNRFNRERIEASYDKIEDSIQAGKLAHLAELNEGKPDSARIKVFPREELGDIVAAARRAEIQELLGDDYSEANERALMAAFTAVHKERMKRSREEAED